MVQEALFTLDNDGLDTVMLRAPRSLETWASPSYAPYENPCLRRFVEANLTPLRGRARMDLLPADLVAGKNTYAYDAHTYHTKVPPEAIQRLVEHYTDPGDLVLDPFCGSGMTGLAALRAGRKPILIDLSPAATFIALNFATPIDDRAYLRAVKEILSSLRDEETRLYGTHCRKCGKLVAAEYMVWSYGLECRHCGSEFILWDVARDERASVRESKIRTEFDCPHCAKHLKKGQLRRTAVRPVQVGYRCCPSGLQESKAVPDEYDLSLVCGVELPNEFWYPTAQLPAGINTRQAIAHGLLTVDALYTARNLRAMAHLWDIARRWPDEAASLKLMFTVTSLYQRVTKLSEFRFWGGSGNIANYNVPMIFNEQNVFKVWARKAKTIRDYLATWRRPPDVPYCISTQSATDLGSIPDNSVDYLFTDPPFGGNINYSEMNLLWEAWLGVHTVVRDEAIINKVQGKTVDEYQQLMTQAFSEMHRVLKPGRCATVMFHNSSSKVWSAIQEALASSGLHIEQTQTLDKRHGTFKQFVSENAVGYDLLLHCRKSLIASIPAIDGNRASMPVVKAFLQRTLARDPDTFIVRYLHVKRESELDSRKLYALWLREHLESGQTIDLDYEQFRELVYRLAQRELKSISGPGRE